MEKQSVLQQIKTDPKSLGKFLVALVMDYENEYLHDVLDDDTIKKYTSDFNKLGYSVVLGKDSYLKELNKI